MRSWLVISMLGGGVLAMGCTPPVPPPRTPLPAPALLDTLDSLGCSPRPRKPAAVKGPAVGGPEPIRGMKDGKRHGLWATYPPNGQQRTEGHYVDGLEDGMFRQWGEDGRLFGEVEMKRGTGTMMWWCDNGTLTDRHGLKDGVPDGPTERWSCNGVLLEKGQYVKRMREGEWTRYDEGGRLLERELYSDREMRRTGSRYWPDRGLTRWDRSYVQGLLDGPTAWFDAKGQKVVEGAYRTGYPTGTWTAYSGAGKKLEEMVIDAKAPRHTTWDPGGGQGVTVEMDAKWNVVRIDGKDAKAACLMGVFLVQTDRIEDAPMSFAARGALPCSQAVPALGGGNADVDAGKQSPEKKGDSKKVAR